jgi:arylsulfate sulfotransferase
MTTRSWLGAGLVLAFALSCAGSQQSEDAGTVEESPPDAGAVDSGTDAGEVDAGTDAGLPDAGFEPLAFEVSSGALIPDFSPEVTSYTLSSFTRLDPVSVTVHGATTATLDGTPVFNGVPQALPPITIDENAGFTVELDSVSYQVKVQPEDFPPLTVTGTGMAGQILIAPGRYLLILDHTGAVLFFRRLQNMAWDFKRTTLPEGTARYSYMTDGLAWVLDESLRPLKSYSPLATAAHIAYRHGMHDFEILGEDHVLMQAHIPKTVLNIPAEIPQAPGGSKVTAGFIQEVKDGQVVFEWDSTDHPELYALSTDQNDFVGSTANYAHLNSMEVDPYDQNLVVGFRNLDTILKIDRETGAILWRLGGPDDSFGSLPQQRPSHQHTAQIIGPNRLQLFDNGVSNHASRIVTYDLDTVNGTLAGFEKLELGYFTSAMGSVQQLSPDALFIGLGVHDLGTPDVIEVNRVTGATSFTIEFQPGMRNYRAFKYP